MSARKPSAAPVVALRYVGASAPVARKPRDLSPAQRALLSEVIATPDGLPFPDARERTAGVLLDRDLVVMDHATRPTRLRATPAGREAARR